VKIEIICPSISHKSSDYDFQVLCVTTTSSLSAQIFYISGSHNVFCISQRIRGCISVIAALKLFFLIQGVIFVKKNRKLL